MLNKLTLTITLLLGHLGYGQAWPSIHRVTDSAAYFEMEPLVDSCISYLGHTLPQDDFNGRMDAVNFLDAWISGVPYVIISQREYMLEASHGNLELTTQHVAGKLYYLRTHPGTPSNSYASELAGTLWMLKLYEDGIFPDYREMKSLLQKRDDGELEEWLKNELPSSWNIQPQENE